MLTPVFDYRSDNYSGGVQAPVELVQYGDYRCQYCAEAHLVIIALQKVFGQSLRFIFRNFPLPNVHALSLESAVAAEAAGRQAQFWEMHELLLENQKFLNRASLTRMAEALRLDMDQFGQDCRNTEIFQKVTSDFEGGIRSGVDGTPTFFINGQRYNGFTDFNGLYNACHSVNDYSEHFSQQQNQ